MVYATFIFCIRLVLFCRAGRIHIKRHIRVFLVFCLFRVQCRRVFQNSLDIEVRLANLFRSLVLFGCFRVLGRFQNRGQHLWDGVWCLF